jgi:hypothetical protein
LRLMQDATKDLYEAREFMRAHSTTRNRSIGHHCAKLAIENLRAARLIYDKLPRYAK